MRAAIPYLVGSIAVGYTSACGYGPPLRYTDVQNYVTDSGASRTAVSFHYAVRREAAGLRAFPDGGVPKILEEGIEVFVCDEPRGSVLKAATISRPDEMRTSFSGWALGMRGDTVYLRLTGYAGNESTPSGLRTTLTRVLPGGRSEPADSPPSLVTGSNILRPFCRHFVDSLYEASLTRRP